MLPAPLLLVSSREGHRGRVTPRYLGGRDEVWVRAVHQELDAFVGRPSRERDADLPARVHAIASHLVLPGDSLEKIRASGVFATVCGTDSHPGSQQLGAENLTPVAPLFARALLRSR